MTFVTALNQDRANLVFEKFDRFSRILVGCETRKMKGRRERPGQQRIPAGRAASGLEGPNYREGEFRCNDLCFLVILDWRAICLGRRIGSTEVVGRKPLVLGFGDPASPRFGSEDFYRRGARRYKWRASDRSLVYLNRVDFPRLWKIRNLQHESFAKLNRSN